MFQVEPDRTHVPTVDPGHLIDRVKMVHRVIRANHFPQMRAVAADQPIIGVLFLYKNNFDSTLQFK